LKIIKQLLLSALCGVAVTFLLFKVLHHASEDWNANVRVVRFLGELYFWPSFSLSWSWVGLDCPNADSIADKMACFSIATAGDAFTYSALCFGVLWTLKKRRSWN
jgi:hypothetical protein